MLITCLLQNITCLTATFTYFSIDNAHPKLFDIPFDVHITRMKLTSGRVRKYRPLLTEDTGVIPKKRAWLVAEIFCIDNARVCARYLYKKLLLLARHVF
jgi:hypothetical protein